ncbi:DNA-binding protein [Escherichia coli]|uniref:DNA-binding protein n=1 Tax=Escherichia coli TaxID=562 RepID=UPI0023F71096|nr:DNA-binding protein [Escherichia coli]
MPGVTFFCISDTLVPTTYLVDTTLSNSSDSDQTVQAVRLQMLNDVERRSLLNAVIAITAVKERSVVSVSSRKEQSKKEKKEREIDPRFPNAGVAWNEADESLLRDVLEDVPDDEIGKHLFWLAEKLGRTPYSVACKVRQIKKLPAEWKDQFRKISDRIRSSGMSVSEYLQRQGLLSPESGEENNPVSHNNNVA